jgi:hypothetical protein
MISLVGVINSFVVGFVGTLGVVAAIATLTLLGAMI